MIDSIKLKAEGRNLITKETPSVHETGKMKLYSIYGYKME